MISVVESIKISENVMIDFRLAVERIQTVLPSEKFLQVKPNTNKQIVLGPVNENRPKWNQDGILFRNKLFARRLNANIAAGLVKTETKV